MAKLPAWSPHLLVDSILPVARYSTRLCVPNHLPVVFKALPLTTQMLSGMMVVGDLGPQVDLSEGLLPLYKPPYSSLSILSVTQAFACNNSHGKYL